MIRTIRLVPPLPCLPGPLPDTPVPIILALLERGPGHSVGERVHRAAVPLLREVVACPGGDRVATALFAARRWGPF